MNLRAPRREEPDINLTPLIDVVFLMLIFFMISTTFLQEGNLRLVLPEASPEPVAQERQTLELTVNADGQYFLDGKPLLNRQAETVRRALRQLVVAGDQRPLIIRADANTPHQAVVTALDAAGQAGITQVAIATTPAGEE